MAKINNGNSYPVKPAPLSGADTAIGTDSETTDKETKQLSVQAIADFTLDQSNVVNSVTGSDPIKVTPTSGDVVVSHDTSGVTATSYQYANIVVDEYGHVTAAYDGTPVTSVNGVDGAVTLSAGTGASVVTDPSNPQNIIISAPGGGGGSGSVTEVNTGIGLSGGPITTTGTIDLDNTGVAAGTYDLATVTVDLQGRITSASNGPNIDLQYVLDNGGVANSGNIALTSGSLIAPTGVIGTINSSAVTIQDLTLTESLIDGNSSTGTLGQVLVSDPTLNGGAGGVVWSDVTTRVAKATVSSAALNAATPVTVVAAPGAGKYIQVISAAAKYNYGTSNYSFSSPLKLYSNLNSAQFELNEAFLLLPASQIRAMSLTDSGALDENTAVFFSPTTIPSGPAGDGDIELNIEYRIVEF